MKNRPVASRLHQPSSALPLTPRGLRIAPALLLLATALGTLLGCSGNPNTTGLAGLADKQKRQQVSPTDFATGQSRAQRTAAAATTESTPAPSESTDTPSAPLPPLATNETTPEPTPEKPAHMTTRLDRFTIDAMVGQVNGEPVFAQDVFDPIHEQLQALGRSLTLSRFQREAKKLINGRLNEIITDALILGEATRDLQQYERLGLEDFLQKKADEIVRQKGQGSQAVANATLFKETGYTFEETIERERKKILVQRYLRKTLTPNLQITRRDIERFYNDHPERYQPAAQRTLHLIQAIQGPDSETIQKRLDAGEPFTRVATDDANRYKRTDAGLFAQDAQGETVFGLPELNAAMLQLSEGQTSEAIAVGGRVFWVYLDTLHQPEPKRLRDVQLDITDELREVKYRGALQDYRQDLYNNGSYTSPNTMMLNLLDVATARYASVTLGDAG